MLLFLCYLLLQKRDFSFFSIRWFWPKPLLSSAQRTISGIPLSRLIPSFTACNPAYASAVNGSSMLE
ncbi:hypothetical protein ES332_D02G038000v1 [Gossypium tomentosum]|uniref:Uncharacterized protein n=1 Tax=Gossypium tomentosum TaxID=34277 RepID=A0A5D2LSW4_GOSTO|nr:hypothetical protein ES332_D02G038000v1 [Gossypium tomentosum]